MIFNKRYMLKFMRSGYLFFLISLAAHVVVFGAGHMLWPIIASSGGKAVLPKGAFLTAEVSFVPAKAPGNFAAAPVDASSAGIAHRSVKKAYSVKNINKSQTQHGSSLPAVALPLKMGGSAASLNLVLAPSNKMPMYPESARANGQEAICPMRLFVRPDGTVSHAIKDGQGVNCMPIFIEEAQRAIQLWRFEGMGNAKSQDLIEVAVPLTFQLTDANDW